jgi:hypothetical protein
MPSGWNDEADRTQWRDILRSFGNVKTLVVRQGLVGELSRSLQSCDGDSPAEMLLPDLKELLYSAASDEGTEEAFTPFINARQSGGSPFERTSLEDARTLRRLSRTTTPS